MRWSTRYHGPAGLRPARGARPSVPRRLLGLAGCGKSLLVSLLAGFERPTAGSVVVDGREVAGSGPERGNPSLHPWLDVRDNVAFGLRMRGVGKRARLAAADEQLARVGLADLAGARPHELSGGMQQRCQIARMLACEPRIMLLDDPFGALDAPTRGQLRAELHGIWRESGRTAILITDDVDEAAFLGTRVLMMSGRPGRIVLDERVPAGDEPRTAALLTEPAFVAFRKRLAERVPLRTPAPA